MNSIKTKIIILIIFSTALILGVFNLLSYKFFIESYSQIEKDDVLDSANIAKDAFENEVNLLSIKLKDWSNWDDTYQYIQDKNKDYEDSNLVNATLYNLQINLMLFIDSSGSEAARLAVDYEKQKSLPQDIFIIDLKTDKFIITHANNDSDVKGIYPNPGGGIILSSRPITTGDGTATSAGSLIFAKRIDSSFVKKIADLTHLDVDLYFFNNKSLPAEIMEVKEEIVQKDSVTRDLSNTKIGGYTLVRDIKGNPSYIIKVEKKREIYIQGTSIITTFVIMIFALIIVTISGLVFFINRIVFSRVSKITKFTTDVANSHNLLKRIDVKGNDEISQLSFSINQMLSDLLFSKQSQEESSKKIESLAQDYKKKAEEQEELNKTMVGREIKMAEMKKELDDIKNKEQA